MDAGTTDAGTGYAHATFAHVLDALPAGGGGHTYIYPSGAKRLSATELVACVHARARQLHAAGLVAGDRVAFVIPELEPFIHSFLGAMRAGIVPVPLYPPMSLGNFEAYVTATAQLCRVARVRRVLTTRIMAPFLAGLRAQVEGLEGIDVVEDLPAAEEGTLPPVDSIHPDDTVFLQFTSGSTDRPKCVRVTHRGLVANAHAIMVDGLHADENDLALSWLPLYHDMGLIGFVLAPLYSRTPAAFLPTFDFIKRPAVWLEALSTYRATITFAPNFAYALATRKGEPTPGMDLSRMRVFGCGAEPIHADTLRAFVDRFAPAGLRAEAMMPCYGMAEATLAMCFWRLDAPLHADVVERDAYHQDRRAVAAAEGLEIVACGAPLPRHRVRAVDEDGHDLGERRVGELVFEGPSIAGGYFDNDEATRAAFRAGGLHTGDLGYVADGIVYVTGRKKDLLIVRGRNYDPQLVEQAAGGAPGVRKGAIVAFTRPAHDTEELVVVVEASAGSDELIAAIRRRVQASVGIPVADVVLLAPGQLPKTTSGKLQRRKTRDDYLAGAIGAGERLTKRTTHALGN